MPFSRRARSTRWACSRACSLRLSQGRMRLAAVALREASKADGKRVSRYSTPLWVMVEEPMGRRRHNPSP